MDGRVGGWVMDGWMGGWMGDGWVKATDGCLDAEVVDG